MLPLQACAQLMQTVLARVGLFIMILEPTICRILHSSLFGLSDVNFRSVCNGNFHNAVFIKVSSIKPQGPTILTSLLQFGLDESLKRKIQGVSLVTTTNVILSLYCVYNRDTYSWLSVLLRRSERSEQSGQWKWAWQSHKRVYVWLETRSHYFQRLPRFLSLIGGVLSIPSIYPKSLTFTIAITSPSHSAWCTNGHLRHLIKAFGRIRRCL